MKSIPALSLLLVFSACAPVAFQTAGRTPAEPPGQATADSLDIASIARGAAFTQAKCSGCHAMGASGESAMRAAPPLHDLGRRYPVDQLAEAFAEGVVTAHPAMPEFVLTEAENRDLIAYLSSIQSGTDEQNSAPTPKLVVNEIQ